MITTALFYPDRDVEFLGSVPPHAHLQDNWDMVDDTADWFSDHHLDAIDQAIEAHDTALRTGRTYHSGRA